MIYLMLFWLQNQLDDTNTVTEQYCLTKYQQFCRKQIKEEKNRRKGTLFFYTSYRFLNKHNSRSLFV
jgi:hypothetical protein